ncbi:hypothetical protein ABZ953_21065 [Streptomyces sp. NPDC046465]|uniref:hypothetical protein n=1 Tax=Streptomyces sp. NPDC046465 TaxID=3155810 RepID=UPI003405E75A
MPSIQLPPGVYTFDAHIIGSLARVTSGQERLDHGVPVTTAAFQEPFFQEWEVLPEGPGYRIHLADQEELHLVTAEDRLWVSDSGQPSIWTFEKTLGGIHILSEKGLRWRSRYLGGQVDVTTPEVLPNQIWTVRRVRDTD